MIRGILPLVGDRGRQGLDPLEGELLDDVGPLPLGGQLTTPLLELCVPMLEPAGESQA